MNPPFGTTDNRTLTDATNLGDAVGVIIRLIDATVPAVIGLILVFIIWKIIDTWILNAGDEKKVTEGKQYIVTAIIVMVVFVSVWGIVLLLRNSIFL